MNSIAIGNTVIPQNVAAIPDALEDGGGLSGRGKLRFFLNGIIILPIESRSK